MSYPMLVKQLEQKIPLFQKQFYLFLEDFDTPRIESQFTTCNLNEMFEANK